MAIASGAGLHTAFAILGHSEQLAEHLKGDVAGILELQTVRPSGTFTQLLALHDFLSDEDVPIDYARRRHTFRAPRRPSKRLARRVAEESGLEQTEWLTAFMGWYVYELLTGHDILFTDPYLDVLAGNRRAYAAVRQRWRTDPPPTLLQVAERALQVNHLDEPITWSPRRAADGVYDGPVPDKTRQLSGWHDVTTQGGSRHLSARDGRPLAEVITIAEHPDRYDERRLRIDLARFRLVAESLDMSAVAHRLCLAPRTLSESVRRLEQRLGHQLFERTGRGLLLTQPGGHLQRLVDESNIDPLTDGRKP